MPAQKLNEGTTYRIRNKKANTILDLSGTDRRSIIGYSQNDGANQHWRLARAGNDWVLINRQSSQFLGIGYATPNDGTVLIGQDHECKWAIWDHSNGSHQLFIPGTSWTVDLSGHGDATNETVVQLWSDYQGQCQQWYFEPVSQ